MRESSLELIDQLKEDLTSQPTQVYLLVSEEPFLVEQALSTMVETWLGREYDPLQVIHLDNQSLNPEYYLANVLTFGIFSQRRIALLKEADGISAETASTIVDSLEQIPPDTLLVCTVKGKNPPRNSLVKAIKNQGTILELPPLRGRELYRWCQKEASQLGLSLSPEVEAELVATFGSSLYQLQNELEKIASYIGKVQKQLTIADLKAVMGRSSLHSIFNLTDALGQKNLGEARKELIQLLRSGESAMYIITMLQWHLANLWQCKALPSNNSKQVASELGIHPYVASKALKQAANFSLAELERAYLMTVDTEFRLKTGKAPHIDVELDRLLVKLT